MEEKNIDINCDLGEGIGNEEQLLPFISSCSIACGGHAGDNTTIRTVARLAKENGVKIGAHPSYPDKEHFGRVSMHISKDELKASLKRQVDNFATILKEEQIELHHIKPHGALYNDIASDTDLARTFLESVEAFKHATLLYVPFDSVIEGEALTSGFQIRYEAFGDRNYTHEGLLIPRSEDNALISNPQDVLDHIARIVHEREVMLPNKKRIRMLADTYCIHGDTPSALEILMYISKCQAMYNLQIKK